MTAPDAPVVNAISADDKVVSGTGEASTTAIAKVNGQEIGRAKVAENGKFQIAIPQQAENAVVSVTLVDAANNVSDAVEKNSDTLNKIGFNCSRNTYSWNELL